jgi:hypothetical protein
MKRHGQTTRQKESGLSIFVFVAILLFLGMKSSALAISGGLSANSINSANVTAHTLGNTSKLKSGGLSANSVNSANVTSLEDFSQALKY